MESIPRTFDTLSSSRLFPIVKKCLILLVIFSCTFIIYFYWAEGRISFLGISARKLKIYPINFEKTRAFVILTPAGKTILIDAGGEDRKILTKLGSILPFYKNKIDLLIISSMDINTIGGVPYVLEKYNVKNIMLPLEMSIVDRLISGKEPIKGYSKSFIVALNALVVEIRKQKTKVVVGKKGMRVLVGVSVDGETQQMQNVSIDVLFPDRTFSEIRREIHDGVLVSKFTYGKTDFVFSDGVSGPLGLYVQGLINFKGVDIYKIDDVRTLNQSVLFSDLDKNKNRQLYESDGSIIRFF